MSAHTEAYRNHVSEIIRDAEKKLGDKYEENLSLGRQSLIREFLDAVVSCGEITETNRLRIEGNPSLKDFFPQTPEEIEMASTEGEEDEEDEVFKGRTTFPEEKCEQTNDFIIEYIGCISCKSGGRIRQLSPSICQRIVGFAQVCISDNRLVGNGVEIAGDSPVGHEFALK